MMDTLTYEMLFEVLRREKLSPELLPLDAKFQELVVEYLKDKEAIVKSQESSDSIFSSEAVKTKRQVENAKKLVRDLYEKRESKIVQLALLSSRANVKERAVNMLPREKDFFQELMRILNAYRDGVLVKMLAGEVVSVSLSGDAPKGIKSVQSESVQAKLVRVVHPIPQFVADDLMTYGPLDQEDVCLLPRKTADLLVKKKKVEEIQVENSEEDKKVVPEV